MPDTGTPPPVPPEFQIYKWVPVNTSTLCKNLILFHCSSYLEDPHWQRRFSITWVSLVGVAILVSLPHQVRSIKSRRAFLGFFGIWEDFPRRKYTLASSEVKTSKSSSSGKIAVRFSALQSIRFWSLPGLALNAGQSAITIEALVFDPTDNSTKSCSFSPTSPLFWCASCCMPHYRRTPIALVCPLSPGPYYI